MTRDQLTTLIESISNGDKNTAAEVRAVFNAFKDGFTLSGDIKWIDVDESYISINFDATGLGRNERLGWARCNGLNGTSPIEDRFIIAQGPLHNTLRATGGAETVILTAANIPELTIPYTGSNDDTGDVGNYLITSPTDSNGAHELKTNGGNTPVSTISPYIVLTCIKKL